MTHHTTYGIGDSPKLPNIQLSDHSIVVTREEVACTFCEERERVPDIFLEGDDYRETLYRMYLIASFKNMSCNSTTQNVGSHGNMVPADISAQNISITPSDKSIQEAKKIAKKIRENQNHRI